MSHPHEPPPECDPSIDPEHADAAHPVAAVGQHPSKTDAAFNRPPHLKGQPPAAMQGRQAMMKHTLSPLVIAGALLLLGACAQPSEERALPEDATTYRAPAAAQETSPLIYDQGGLDEAPENVDEEAYNATAEQCHNYARGVVLQDRRISHDRDAGRLGQLGSSRTLSLQRSMQDFGEQGSYERHFTSCMQSRGVSQAQ